MLSFYFVGLIAAGSLSLSANELNMYETKLRNYQNLTNIDEATFQEIWKTGSKNSKWLSMKIMYTMRNDRFS